MSIIIALVVGTIVGWIARAALDRAVSTIAIRVISSAIGKEKMAEALAKIAAEKGLA